MSDQPDRKDEISRRRALKIIGAGIGAAGSLPVLEIGALGQHRHGGAPRPGAAQAAVQPEAAPRFFTPQESALVTTISDMIIPTDAHSPGAKAAGVPAFIDRAIGNWCDAAQAKTLRDGLAKLDADAKAAGAMSFAALPPIQQTALLARSEAERSAFFWSLKELVTIGYFTSKPGATIALRYDPVPGAYRGCVPLKEIGRAWAT